MLHDESAALDLGIAADSARPTRCPPQRARTIRDRRIEVITLAGAHTFTDHDRLLVRGATKSESRPAAQLCAGDLIAFLGRVVAVRIIAPDDEC